MSFGVGVRNGLPLGLGSIPSLYSGLAQILPPGTSWDVRLSGGETFSVPYIAMASDGTKYTVTADVRSSAGVTYTPI